ncbi:hypothetical protein [Kitasatospora sp. NPDC001175]|uniref:hypothetical protein n=1 Tax=Kitasatospora sp. NPDC001175 TaxID=3157103 RepID=UPI003D07A5A9
MSDDLLPDLHKTAIEPTQVVPGQPEPPQDDDPFDDMPPTVLVSVRTVPDPDADPAPEEEQPKEERPEEEQPKPLTKRPKRDRSRKVRLAKRLKRRPPSRSASPDPDSDPETDEDENEEEETEEDDATPAAAPTRRRFTLRREPSPKTGPRTLSQKQRGRLKAIAVTAIAAGIGWQLYLGPFLITTIHTIGHASPRWAVGVGLGFVAAGLYVDFFLRGGTTDRGAIRVRDITGWGLIFATIARIPLGTALLALGLYAPGRI